ncbi:electron transfer flavoprotein subunit alpha/FixB family protein [Micrococcoides hystricis]|uniref:Electron transfer flavoprotein subunit alpha/FixB family protein n=1 Tax=Micrococcoides hystricis TaxID=1572761 RepID=A0ABV6P8E0_9MICC
MTYVWQPSSTDVLVYVRCHEDGRLENASLGTLQKIQKHGLEPIVILNRPVGSTVSLPGNVKAVYAPDSDISQSFLTGELALIKQVLAALIPDITQLVVFASGNTSTDLAAMLAVQRGGAVITGVQKIAFENNELFLRKYVLGGTWQTDSSPQTNFATITLHAKPIPGQEMHTMTVSAIPVTLNGGPQIIDRKPQPVSERPELTEAAVVVTGGRGTNGDFSVVEDLADSLEAAIGATRDAVDEGWADHSMQVGQTGKTVSPQVYIAAGVSGAIHQRVGMDTAENIIAINSDEDAPIFEIATVGIVGDLFDVLPELTERINQRKTS